MSNVEHINLTPTWAAAAEILILALENGTPIGKAAAEAELRRMATILDELNRDGFGTKSDDTAAILQSHWDNHPEWDVEDWRLEVQNDDTRLGYLDWVAAREVEKEADLHRDSGTG